MVTFSCDLCADAVKKPKAVQHMMRCRATVTCVDCGKVFDINSVNMHNSCVSEAEKYQGRLYVGPKHAEGANMQGSVLVGSVDLSLIRGPPWVCKMCNVTCSGRDNLIAHHQSKKHVNKAKHVASGKIACQDNVPSGTPPILSSSEAQSCDKGSSVVDNKARDDSNHEVKKKKKDKKEKKDKQERLKKDKKNKKRICQGSQELQGISKPKNR